jgi:GDP-L-fucose synthase
VSSARPRHELWSNRRVAVTGGAGFLGAATVRMLDELDATVRIVRSSEHDLRDAEACRRALGGSEVVFHLAANVGGIGYNQRNPAPLARDNLAMAINVFEACRDLGVEKLVVACSVCAYPHHTPVPFREDEIWNGYPEPNTAPYGAAKRMSIVLSDAYRRQYGLDSSVPLLPNLYGPGDNYDLEDSHVVAAMVRKFVEAADHGEERVVLWGTGSPTRELLYVDDAVRALLLIAERYDSSEPINIGTGKETSISELAKLVGRLAGFEGETVWDASRPDGQPRRYLDISRAKERLGFEAQVSLEEGLSHTIERFRATAAAQPA